MAMRYKMKIWKIDINTRNGWWTKDLNINARTACMYTVKFCIDSKFLYDTAGQHCWHDSLRLAFQKPRDPMCWWCHFAVIMVTNSTKVFKI